MGDVADEGTIALPGGEGDVAPVDEGDEVSDSVLEVEVVSGVSSLKRFNGGLAREPVVRDEIARGAVQSVDGEPAAGSGDDTLFHQRLERAANLEG